MVAIEGSPIPRPRLPAPKRDDPAQMTADDIEFWFSLGIAVAAVGLVVSTWIKW